MDDTTPTPPETEAWPGHRRRLAFGIGAIVVAVGIAAVAVAATSGSSGHSAGADAKGTRSHTSITALAPNGASGSSGTTTATGPGASASVGGATLPGDGNRGSSTPGGPGGTGSTSPTTKAPGSRGTKPAQPQSDVSPAITAAYVSGYTNECHRIWDQAGPSGKLWDADELDSPPHVISECLSELDPSNSWFYFQDTPKDAREGGKEDADSTASGLTLGDRFQTATGLVIYIN